MPADVASRLKLTAVNRDQMDISKASVLAESASKVSDTSGASAAMSRVTGGTGLPGISLPAALILIYLSGSHECSGLRAEMNFLI